MNRQPIANSADAIVLYQGMAVSIGCGGLNAGETGDNGIVLNRDVLAGDGNGNMVIRRGDGETLQHGAIAPDVDNTVSAATAG